MAFLSREGNFPPGLENQTELIWPVRGESYRRPGRVEKIRMRCGVGKRVCEGASLCRDQLAVKILRGYRQAMHAAGRTANKTFEALSGRIIYSFKPCPVPGEPCCVLAVPCSVRNIIASYLQ